MSSSIKYYLFAALAVLLFSLPAHSARRDGLNGNLLIKDHDDVFVYPQKAHSEFNKDRIRVDLADSTSATFFNFTGNGAWGLSIGNGLVGPAGLRVSADALAFLTAQQPNALLTLVPNQVVDGFYSGKAGGGDYGVRLSLGSAGQSPGGDAPDASSTYLGFSAGYSKSGDFSFDGALNVALLMASQDDTFESTGNQITASFRGYKKSSEKVELGILGDVAFGGASYEPEGGEAQDFSGLRAGVGAGPVYNMEGATVATYAVLNFETKTDPNDNSETFITLPGVNAAFEAPLNDWVNFRGGVGYSFALNSVTPDQGDESSSQGGGTSSSLGLSAYWDKLNFDVNLNPAFFTNGPYLLTGTGTQDFAASTSITYAW